jgi:hypothetical protein
MSEMDFDEAPVSPEMSNFDQTPFLQGPVTPWIPNATELENERQVKFLRKLITP